jgi:RNA polymerase-binding protein DksA
MTKAELENFRQQLLKLGQRLKSDFSDLQSEALRNVGGEPSGSLSNVPLHLADLGSDTYERELSLSLLQNEEQTLEEVAAALQRIEQGSYGRCENCGKEIGRERLKAVPFARLCIDCARQAAAPPQAL